MELVLGHEDQVLVEEAAVQGGQLHAIAADDNNNKAEDTQAGRQGNPPPQSISQPVTGDQ